MGEHVQASDDQGWVQLEVEGVWMLFPTAEPREMSLSAHNHFILKHTHLISELNRHQYAHVSVYDNMVWFGCSRAPVLLPVWLGLKHTGMSALAYSRAISKPPAQTQTLFCFCQRLVNEYSMNMLLSQPLWSCNLIYCPSCHLLPFCTFHIRWNYSLKAVHVLQVAHLLFNKCQNET